MREISSKCHSKLILVPYHKPLDPMMDIYDGQNFDLKTRVDIWMRMYVVPVEYGYFGLLLRLFSGGIVFNGGSLIY